MLKSVGCNPEMSKKIVTLKGGKKKCEENTGVIAEEIEKGRIRNGQMWERIIEGKEKSRNSR